MGRGFESRRNHERCKQTSLASHSERGGFCNISSCGCLHTYNCLYCKRYSALQNLPMMFVYIRGFQGKGVKRSRLCLRSSQSRLKIFFARQFQSQTKRAKCDQLFKFSKKVTTFCQNACVFQSVMLCLQCIKRFATVCCIVLSKFATLCKRQMKQT